MAMRIFSCFDAAGKNTFLWGFCITKYKFIFGATFS
jgi:hypothetical protein